MVFLILASPPPIALQHATREVQRNKATPQGNHVSKGLRLPHRFGVEAWSSG